MSYASSGHMTKLKQSIFALQYLWVFIILNFANENMAWHKNHSKKLVRNFVNSYPLPLLQIKWKDLDIWSWNSPDPEVDPLLEFTKNYWQSVRKDFLSKIN
jgi:hypothetical protein